MSSAEKEDHFPLLFVVNMRGDSLEKPPLDPTPSIRDRNVSRGAATLISRWPQHVESTSRLAFFTAFTILCMSFFIVAVIFYTSDYTFGVGFGFRQHPRRRIGMCNLDKNHMYENMHDGADVSALVKFMSPLPRAWEFFSDEEKIFFVMSQGDTLTAEKKCAIESAVRANANATVFLLVLVDHPKSIERTEVAEEEAAFNDSIGVVYVDVVRYMKDTPLSGFWHRGVANKGLRVLAVKLVTLWRFGGLSLDVDLLSLKEARLPRRKTKNARADMDGRILSVHYPCHAFMFQAMKVLEKMQLVEAGNDAAKEFNAGAVISVAQDIYCRKPHCRNRSGNSGKCPGFKVLPKDIVCSLEHQPDNGTCVWASFTQQDVDKKYFNDVCAISSNSQPNPIMN